MAKLLQRYRIIDSQESGANKNHVIRPYKITYNPSSHTDLCTFIITYKTQVAVQGISLKRCSLANTPLQNCFPFFQASFPSKISMPRQAVEVHELLLIKIQLECWCHHMPEICQKESQSVQLVSSCSHRGEQSFRSSKARWKVWAHPECSSLLHSQTGSGHQWHPWWPQFPNWL